MVTVKKETTANVMQKAVSIFGFLLFSMFSSLQGNDVMQYGTAQWLTIAWLVGYAILAFICLYNAIKPFPAKLFLYLAVITFSLAIYRGSQINWNEPLFCFVAPEEVEKRNPAGNETGGLVIMTLWLLLVFWANRKMPKE